MKKFIEEFKKFALRGNVMDMAVGVIIGGAFTGIVTALTTNFINPLLSLIFTGGPGDISDGVAWTFGAAFASFLTTVVNFFITALVLFVLLLTGVLDRPLTLLNNLFFYGIAWVFRL